MVNCLLVIFHQMQKRPMTDLLNILSHSFRKEELGGTNRKSAKIKRIFTLLANLIYEKINFLVLSSAWFVGIVYLL